MGRLETAILFLLASLLLILLFFGYAVFLGVGRTVLSNAYQPHQNGCWGQVLYICLATFLYMAFVLVSSIVICMKKCLCRQICGPRQELYSVIRLPVKR